MDNKNFADYLNELNLSESGEKRMVFEHQVMTAEGEKTCRVIVEAMPYAIVDDPKEDLSSEVIEKHLAVMIKRWSKSENNQNENDLKT